MQRTRRKWADNERRQPTTGEPIYDLLVAVVHRARLDARRGDGEAQQFLTLFQIQKGER